MGVVRSPCGFVLVKVDLAFPQSETVLQFYILKKNNGEEQERIQLES